MKALLIYPQYPNSFWSYKDALKFISRKAVNPPLGLLTIAGMMPKEWDKKVIDMNVKKLKDKDLLWADYVFISAMIVQKESVKEVIERCKDKNVKVVAGGPLFTAQHDNYKEGIDHFILNEAEATFEPFLEDLKNNRAKPFYSCSEFPDMDTTPLPRWDLINMPDYFSMNIQYSRGCPFNCEFCDITTLFGRQVRTKTKFQVIAELDAIYANGWRGDVFFVDDNFIGNKNKLKKEVLPAMIAWMKKHKNPFVFMTEASINLADDEQLMEMMTAAGFCSVFIGIETPDETGLTECNKFQNKNRNLIASVNKIQASGLEVSAGFIVGFDSDTPSIFARQIDFIQKSKIITAMVGLLNAPKNTPLYHRLKKENRLLTDPSGSNTDFSTNFIPKMEMSKLVEGYKHIIKEIYSAKPYKERVIGYLKNTQKKKNKSHLRMRYLSAFVKSIFVLGIKDNGRAQYWQLFFWTLFRRPSQFSVAMTFAINGYHYRRVFASYM